VPTTIDVLRQAPLHRNMATDSIARGETLFAEVMERGKAKGRISVRRMQMKLLEQGNATIGVWLYKNILGQVDEVRHDINSGLPLLNLVPLIPPPTHPWSTATALPPPSDTSPKPTFDRNRVGESSYG